MGGRAGGQAGRTTDYGTHCYPLLTTGTARSTLSDCSYIDGNQNNQVVSSGYECACIPTSTSAAYSWVAAKSCPTGLRPSSTPAIARALFWGAHIQDVSLGWVSPPDQYNK